MMFWCATFGRHDPYAMDVWRSNLTSALKGSRYEVAYMEQGTLRGFKARCADGCRDGSAFGTGYIKIGQSTHLLDREDIKRLCRYSPELKQPAAFESKAFSGQFALALDFNDSVYLLNDFYGVRPIYYREDAGTVIFGSDIRSILAFPTCELAIDEVFLVDRLLPEAILGDVESASRGGYAGIKKIPPGSFAKLTRTTSPEIELRTYDRAFLCPPKFEGSFDDAVTEVEDRLKKITHALRPSEGKNLFDLSGGIDSSTVVAAGIVSTSADAVQTGTLICDSNEGHYMNDAELARSMVSQHRLSSIELELQETFDGSQRNVPFLGPRSLANYGYLALLQSAFGQAGHRYHFTGEGADFHFLGTNLIQDADRGSLRGICVPRITPFDAPNWQEGLVQALFRHARHIPALHRWIYRRTLWPELNDNLLNELLLSNMGQRRAGNFRSEQTICSNKGNTWTQRFHLDMLFPRAAYMDEFAHFPVQIVAPYLDIDLISISFALPSHYFIDHSTFDHRNDYKFSKKLLRHAFPETIPRSISQKSQKTSYNEMAVIWYRQNAQIVRDHLISLFEHCDSISQIYDRKKVLITADRMAEIARLPGCSFGVEFNIIQTLYETERWIRAVGDERQRFLTNAYSNYRM